MRIYLDASVVVALLTAEATADAIATYLDRSAGEVMVSDFGRGEFVAALNAKARREDMDRADFPVLMLKADAWSAARTSVTIDPADLRAATDYLINLDIPLRYPDAIHIAIAARCAATLVTLDGQQLSAAVALGVDGVDPLVKPEPAGGSQPHD